MDENSDYKTLNPKSKTAMYIGNTLAYAVLLVIAFAAFYFAGPYVKAEDLRYCRYIVIAAMAVLLVYFVIGPQVFYRRYRYQITSEKVDVRRGILIVRRTMVPIERIHQVEIKRGPINNMLGLADVVVMTAGGVATIQYLDIPEAESVAEELNKVVNSIVRGRKKDD